MYGDKQIHRIHQLYTVFFVKFQNKNDEGGRKEKNFLKLGLSGFTKEKYIGLNISGHRQFCPQAGVRG